MTTQAIEPDSSMAQTWELSEHEFKIRVINMLRALMEKVGNMEEQKGKIIGGEWKL